MSVHVLYSDVFYLHRPLPGAYHPENPSRLDVAISAIKRVYMPQRIIVNSRINYSIDYLHYIAKVHDASYIELINSLCSTGNTYIDSDTYISRDTCRVVEVAVAASIKSIEIALSQSDTLVFALVRPPGHHAGRYGRAMGAPTQGFCIYNNIAAAALYAVDRGYAPIAIMDIDVHHGNGTQEVFWYEPTVIHIDIHQYGIYPGTGSIDAIGGGEARGTKINIPLPPYSRDDDYLYVINEVLTPVMEAVKPRAIAVSAGFDAYRGDGLSEMELTQKFYGFYGMLLRALSKKIGIGVAAVLEGGYSVGLRDGIPSFINGFLSDFKKYEEELKAISPSRKTVEIAMKIKNVLKPFMSIS
ncbi:MAG: histone deacetylase family protein [Ignisphaera sp.]|nr:histone deacetylase family protein [Ignisphaera sp.]MDW8085772.1 histone deacetylase family protein [Ignisphaera sp.]